MRNTVTKRKLRAICELLHVEYDREASIEDYRTGERFADYRIKFRADPKVYVVRVDGGVITVRGYFTAEGFFRVQRATVTLDH